MNFWFLLWLQIDPRNRKHFSNSENLFIYYLFSAHHGTKHMQQLHKTEMEATYESRCPQQQLFRTYDYFPVYRRLSLFPSWIRAKMLSINIFLYDWLDFLFSAIKGGDITLRSMNRGGQRLFDVVGHLCWVCCYLERLN